METLTLVIIICSVLATLVLLALIIAIHNIAIQNIANQQKKIWMEILAQVLIIIASVLAALILLALIIAIIYWRIFILCHTSKLTKEQKEQQANSYKHFRNQARAQQQVGDLHGIVA